MIIFELAKGHTFFGCEDQLLGLHNQKMYDFLHMYLQTVNQYEVAFLSSFLYNVYKKVNATNIPLED